MTENIRSLRPARAAIAAVLAFSSPSLFAQTVVPPVQPVIADPQTAPTSSSAPAAPVFAPAQPVVQPTPSVDQRLGEAIAASQAEESADAPPAATLVRNAPRPATGQSTRATAPDAPVRQVEPPANREIAPPVPLPAAQSVAAAEPAVQASQAPVAPSSAAIDPALLWALGGAAILMIGLAGTAMLRKRKRRDEQWTGEVVSAAPVEPSTAPVEPVVTPAQAMPLMTAPPASPLARSHEESDLEAMAAAPPSPENPFRTHAKRRTRAKFLLAQRQKQAESSMTPVTSTAAESPQPVPMDATQTVYRFGSDRRRDSRLRPRTS